jgi:membrane-associated phospholipid phosphatase
VTLRTILPARFADATTPTTVVPSPNTSPDQLAVVRTVAPAVGIFLIVLVALVANTNTIAPIFALGLIGLIFATTRPGAASRPWALYFFAVLCLTFFRSFADETGIPIHFGYAADIDRAIFGGTLPTAWLQDQLYRVGQTRLLDWAAVVVYASFFFLPHIAGIIIWRRHRHLLGRYVAAIATLIGIGLLGHYLLPTAPPWLVAQEGGLPDITRIVFTAVSSGGADLSDQANTASATNAVAAMPSLHTGFAVLIALAAWRSPRPIRILALLYPIAMALTLVYTGEHYVVDILAGAGIALIAWRIAASVTRTISDRWPQADPPQPSARNAVAPSTSA